MADVQRPIHTLDAAGQAPGRLASRVALLLIGKHKPAFTPHVDLGDAVKVVNAAKMAVTGKKLEQTVYRHHTTYPRGLKEVGMKVVMKRDPSDVLRRAVSRMLPKNRHRTARLKRLNIAN